MTLENSRPAGSGPLVSARDIGVRRGERWIIRHVDLEVVRGVLLISHDLERAMETGDDVVVLVPHEHDERVGIGGDSTPVAGYHDGVGPD